MTAASEAVIVLSMNAAHTAKTAAVCIIITRAEGPTNLCGKTRTFAGLNCWAKAKAFMLANSSTFPESGYDKHDFMVVFADGESYEGRLDAKRNGDDCDLARHVRSEVEYMTTSKHLVASDKAEAVAFLAKYDLG